MARPILAFTALMICVLAPVWAYSFVTQDGPAHLYNAEIIRMAFAGHAHPAYELRGQPMPNMLGHLLLALCSAVFGPAVADKILITVTCAALGAAALSLRAFVRGARDLLFAVPLAAFICVNRLWLLGFYSFLLGAALFGVTTSLAWRWRDRWTAVRTAAMSLLLILGYFAHPISLAASFLALLIIAVTTSRISVAFTALSLVPAALMGAYYVAQATARAPLQAQWNLARAFNPRFLTIASTGWDSWTTPAEIIAAIPIILFAAALVLVLTNGFWREHHAFAILAATLFGAAILGPENLGSEHGDFLRQRLFALGCVASAPLFQFSSSRKTHAAALLAAGAVVLQAVNVYGYARHSDDVIEEIVEISPAIGADASVLPLVIREETRFRAAPEQHAANLLGIGNHRTVWMNYEADLYYFPVRYRYLLMPCPADELPRFDAIELPGFTRRRQWLTRFFVCTALVNRDRIDVVLTRGVPPERISPWLEPAFTLQPVKRPGALRMWVKKEAPAVIAGAGY